MVHLASTLLKKNKLEFFIILSLYTLMLNK